MTASLAMETRRASIDYAGSRDRQPATSGSWSRRVGRLLAGGAALLIAGMAAPAAAQEDYPSKPISIIVGFAAGGAGDTATRVIADYVRERWKVPAVVENRVGAGSTIAAGLLARAKPDGYTVALVTTSGYTIAPHFQKVPYDPAKDFSYLFQYLVSAEPLYVLSTSPHKTAQDLVAWAKANPGKLNWSTAATNGGAHIATEVAFRKLGITGQYIPYKGGADAMPALLGGQIDLLVAAGFTPYAKAGQIRLLAESGLQRIPNFPDVPTYKELGWPVGVESFYGMAGPAGMPAPIVARWEALGKDLMTTPAFVALMGKLSTTASYKNSQDFTNSLVGAYKEMGQLIPSLGLKAN